MSFMFPFTFRGLLRRLRLAMSNPAVNKRSHRHSRRFRAEFEMLENRLVPSSSPLSFTAPAGSPNNMVLQLDSTRTNIQILDNGQIVASQALAGTSSVAIIGANDVSNTLIVDFADGNPIAVGGLNYNGGTGPNTVEGTLVLNNGSFSNEVNATSGPHSGTITLDTSKINYTNLTPILDTVAAANYTISAPKTADTINIINDPNSPENGFQTTQVNSGTGGFELVNFANKTNVTVVDTSTGGDDTFMIDNPAPAAGLATLTVDASAHGTGSTFDVLATPATVTTNVVGNAADTVTVGNNHSVQAILGTLNVENQTAHNTLTLDDAGDTVARSVTVNTYSTNPEFGFVSGLAPAGIYFEYGQNSSVTVDGGTGGNTFLVSALPQSATVLNISGGAGTNTLIGPNQTNTFGITASNAGNVDGTTAVNFTNIQNLTGGTGNNTFNLSNGIGITGNINGGGGTDTLNYSQYLAADPITVDLQTSKATNIGGVFSNIQSLVGGGGSNTLVGANTANTWNITAANAGNINGTFSFSAIGNLTGGTANDTFNFSNGVGVSGAVNGGGGTDTLNYSQYLAADPVTVNLQTSKATNIGGVFSNIESLVGGLGSNTLTGANTANTWNITGANAGNVNGTFTFSSIGNLTGGTGQNIFTFAAGGKLAGKINGGGTKGDWLVYTAQTSSVNVNLATGAASLVAGGVTNTQNVIGSDNGGDTITGNSSGGVLVGHNTGNTITAGSGRSVIIGGFGKSLLEGGTTADIIIAGKTNYDANITALASILAEWQSTSAYATRVSLLKNGGGLNGTNTLVLNQSVFCTSTVPGPRFGRGGGNGQSTLVGNGGQNWFFTLYSSAIVDLNSTETVN
jgi:hypothetical protein